MTNLTNLEVTIILCIFRLVLQEKAGKKIPELSRLDFLSFQQTILPYPGAFPSTLSYLVCRGVPTPPPLFKAPNP